MEVEVQQLKNETDEWVKTLSKELSEMHEYITQVDEATEHTYQVVKSVQNDLHKLKIDMERLYFLLFMRDDVEKLIKIAKGGKYDGIFRQNNKGR